MESPIWSTSGICTGLHHPAKNWCWPFMLSYHWRGSKGQHNERYWICLNYPKIQYFVFKNQAKTNQVCHDVEFCHWTEHNKHPRKISSILAIWEPELLCIRFSHITTNIRLKSKKNTTAVKATFQWKLKLLQHTVSSLLTIHALHP